MAQEIYKVWTMKYTPAWYDLTKAEQDALTAKVFEALKSVGGESVMVRVSLWSSENWVAWGVEKFPSIEAVQQHSFLLFNLNWFKYAESSSYLGVEMPQA